MSQPIQKDWMKFKGKEIFRQEYRQGVDFFINFARANEPQSTMCPCPCTKCKNAKNLSYADVRQHLNTAGILATYTTWALHGEKQNTSSVDFQTKEKNKEGIAENRSTGLENLIDASYGLLEGATNDCIIGDDGTIGDDGQNIDFEELFNSEPNIGKRYNEYRRKAEEKLYPGCEGPETTLSAIVELHNLKKQYGWSGASVTALLIVLKRWLPKENTLPEKYPAMKVMLKDLGMKAKCIHACKNNCILYWKEHENAIECPQCKTPRFKVKVGSSKKGRKAESKEPHKVLRHFPLIPRLKRLYTIPWIARDMTWHHRAKSSWDYMRHPIDSVQWRSCKNRWKEFAEDGRNVWLGIATDGFNPRGVQSSSYSCWPVIMVPYNLPPSLCMKSEFQMLSLLIPGPKAPSQDIDVFLQPLVEELKQLWEGVAAYDMDKREHFSLKAMLMWGIHDFPAYGNLSGCVTHGYKACPVCGDDTPSLRLPKGKKIVYTNYRMFLNSDHPFKQGYMGIRVEEQGVAPERLNGEILLRKLSHINYIPGKVVKGSTKKRKSVDVLADSNSGDGNEVTEAWYKRSILFDLEYWIYHRIRHVIDVMHIVKNVAEHIINTILDKKDKTKDTINAREDMKSMGVRSSQWMQTDKTTGKQIKPQAPFHLSKEEKRHFCQILKDLKIPSGFSSNLSNIVTLEPPGLHALKSHDYHVIMQYLLPVLLQHAFPKNPALRRSLHQISLFFNDVNVGSPFGCPY